MRVIDAAEVRKALTFPILVAALEVGHRRPKMEVQDGFLGAEKERSFVRHAVDRGRFMASKLITSFPANLAGGKLPAVQALCVLFDGTNGRPLVVIDGTEITYWRTAAATHFLLKRLPRVATEVALHVLAYNLTRVLNIIGIRPMMAAVGA